MFKNLPTMIWVIGATIAIAAFSPAVGNVATTAPVVVQPPAAPPPAAKPSVTPSPSATPPPSATPSVPPAQPPSAPADAPVVIKAGTTKLGPTAVNAEGLTVYLSVLDSTDPPRSVCLSKTCLTAWKPVYVGKGGVVAGAGVDQAKLGKVVRPDGDVQATLGGWPLYLFIKDKVPGDVLGEGVKGTWHALSPAGKRAAK
jgi:predicted lipoprotein with Yx(FWY)xxD motif